MKVLTLDLFCVRELTIALMKLTLGMRVLALGLFCVRELTLGLRVPTLGLLIFVS